MLVQQANFHQPDEAVVVSQSLMTTQWSQLIPIYILETHIQLDGGTIENNRQAENRWNSRVKLERKIKRIGTISQELNNKSKPRIYM